MKNEYRVIFKGSGKPITGYIVSEPMIKIQAEHYFKLMKDQGYFPELLKIEDANNVA